jgi:hypothetical protein
MKWPNRKEVENSLRQWAEIHAARNPAIAAVGYFGSYSRNQGGVGSDLDVVILLNADLFPEISPRTSPKTSPKTFPDISPATSPEIAMQVNPSFHQRSLSFDFQIIPVPVDAIAYTQAEWAKLASTSPRFYQTLCDETVWVWQRSESVLPSA